VKPTEILTAHKQAQRSRVSQLDEILIVSDTPELVFPQHPSKEGFGDIGNSDTNLEGHQTSFDDRRYSTDSPNDRGHRSAGADR
jgi:hypothetical protein